MVDIDPEATVNRTMQELQRGVSPDVLADIGYDVPEQYLKASRDTGRTAVEATTPQIPADVQAELDAFHASHPPQPRTDQRHISLVNARNRGAL